MVTIDSQSKDWLDLLTALSTIFAVIFAAFSAWTSMQSAKAARDSVEEARIVRRTELAPRLVMEKDFLDLQFLWPHTDSLNGEAVFLSRKHWKDKTLAPPTFTLQNFGQSPALEVTITWELDDPNGDYVAPDAYASVGISLSQAIGTLDDGTPIQSVQYSREDGSGTGLPLYRRWTTDIPSCSPGQNRTIEFPIHILNVLFLRGLQLGATANEQTKIILSARITCYSVDGERHDRIFKWQSTPFSYGQTSPVVVYSHFDEFAIHPKPPGPRVL